MIDPRVLILTDTIKSGDELAQGLIRHAMSAVFLEIDRYTVDLFHSHSYAMVILDINQTEQKEVVSICNEVRTVFEGPLLLLTCEHNERFHLQLYQDGVDECVVKPVGMPLILAKVIAWMRRATIARSQPSETSETPVGAFQLDTLQRILTTPEGRKAHLSELEFRLFHILLSSRGQVLATGSLLDHIRRGNMMQVIAGD